MADFKLNNREKITTGFKVPENYFEDFSAKIMTEINAQEQPEVIYFYNRKIKTWLYAAAAILVIVLMAPIYNNYKPQKALGPVAIENYIIHESTISQYDLMDLLDDKDIKQLNIDMNLEKESIEDVLINSANLENYLTN